VRQHLLDGEPSRGEGCGASERGGSGRLDEHGRLAHQDAVPGLEHHLGRDAIAIDQRAVARAQVGETHLTVHHGEARMAARHLVVVGEGNLTRGAATDDRLFLNLVAQAGGGAGEEQEGGHEGTGMLPPRP